MLFRSFWNDFDSVFDGYSTSRFPAVNVYRDDEKVVIAAELAGVHPENLDVSIKDNIVTLSGDRKVNNPEGAENYRNEITEGKFERNIKLPFAVDSEQVEATVKDGILHLSLAIAESAKPRKIEVKSVNAGELK